MDHESKKKNSSTLTLNELIFDSAFLTNNNNNFKI